MRIKIEGLAELNAKLKALSAMETAAATRALSEIAQDLKGKAQARAPIDTGDLRGSAYVSVDKTTAEVGFTSVYATYQHEGTWFNHPKGGEAKYLENPFKENVDQYTEDLGRAIKRGVDG